MKIYFTASARGLQDLENNYKLIFDTFTQLGHINIDDLLFNPEQLKNYQSTSEASSDLYQRTLKNIRVADVVVLEVSIHSLSMGYVMEKSLESGKPVILLFSTGHYPHFASGINNDKLQVLEYSKENIKQVLNSSLDYAKDSSDTRFNFFISPRHITFLDWVVRTKKIPRSVYLRDLIEKDIDLNIEYNRI